MLEENAVVKVQEHATADGSYAIGHLTLNKPKALNALDLEMASIMLDALQGWQQRNDIVCVVIDAAGDKAFCAGGDIVSMYNAMVEASGKIPAFLEAFFKTEYTLDFTIHNFPKPIVVWGSGIVMGGGMGLLCGASHRVVTETSRLAMPEITIGLYPDVGGSYFLPRLPGKSGLFLGLTGAQMNATDACYVGLGDVIVSSSEKHNLLDALKGADWTGALTKEGDALNAALNSKADEILATLKKPDVVPTPNVEPNMALINSVCESDSIVEVVQRILGVDANEDKWLKRGQNSLEKGSPITMHLVFEQCKRGSTMTLSECFRMEADMSCRCGESGEFQEGVRALLIDKDMAPKWKYQTVEDVPHDVVEHFFSSPWTDEQHPLATL